MSSDTLSVTYEDIDPVVEYTPYSQGDPTHGWETFFPGGQYVPSIGGSHQGIGNSVHRTTSPGTSLHFTFYGTSLRLFGTANTSRYTVTLDNQQAQTGSEKDGVLAEFQGLSAGPHELRLDVVTPSPEFQFDRAIFEVGLKAAYSNVTLSAAATEWHMGGGNWESLDVSPSYDPTQRVALTKTLGSTAQLDFQGTAIFVYGNLMSDHGPFGVELDGEPWAGNGSTYGLVQNSLLYFRAGLDDTKPHSLTLTNTDSPYFDIDRAVIVSFNVQAPDGSSPVPIGQPGSTPLPTFPRQGVSSSTSGPETTLLPPSASSPGGAPGPATAAIVGGAVAGCVIALLIVILMILLWLRRERRRERRFLPQKQDPLAAEPYFVPPPPRYVQPSRPYLLAPSSHPPNSVGPPRTATITEPGFTVPYTVGMASIPSNRQSIPRTVTAPLSPEEYPQSVTAPHASPTQWVPERRGVFQPWSLQDLNRVVHLSSSQLRRGDLEDSRTLVSLSTSNG